MLLGVSLRKQASPSQSIKARLATGCELRRISKGSWPRCPNRRLSIARQPKLAEGVGFEPTRPFGLPVFKTGAINHSTTPPQVVGKNNKGATVSKPSSALKLGGPLTCYDWLTSFDASGFARQRSTFM